MLTGLQINVTYPISFLNQNSYVINVFSVAEDSRSTWHSIATNKKASSINVYLGQYNYEGASMGGFTHNWIAIGLQVNVLNNGVILNYGKLKAANKITLPIAYTDVNYCVVTGNIQNRTDGNLTTYNDLSMYTGAIYSKTLTSFVSRGTGFYLSIGF